MDEDFFSAEAEETMFTPTSDERTQVDQDIQDEIIGVASKITTEEADFSSVDLSDGYKTTAKSQMSESLCELSLHSRDKSKSKSTTQRKSDQKKKKNDSKPDDTPYEHWGWYQRRWKQNTTGHTKEEE